MIHFITKGKGKRDTKFEDRNLFSGGKEANSILHTSRGPKAKALDCEPRYVTEKKN